MLSVVCLKMERFTRYPQGNQLFLNGFSNGDAGVMHNQNLIQFSSNEDIATDVRGNSFEYCGEILPTHIISSSSTSYGDVSQPGHFETLVKQSCYERGECFRTNARQTGASDCCGVDSRSQEHRTSGC